MAKLNFDGINAAALGQLRGLLPQWLPGGVFSGAEYSALNPTRADSRRGSFSINLNSGIWADFSTDDKGSDPVSLFAYLFYGGDQGKAAKDLAAVVGVSTDLRGASSSTPAAADKNPGWVAITPPAGAPLPPVAHPFRGLPDASWRYLDGNGGLLGVIMRFTNSEGGKEIYPLSWCKHSGTGAQEWRFLSFSKPRWLYGIDRLYAKPDCPVLIVEGEKCADVGAANLANFAVMTWAGGSKAVDFADWTPLAGRDVVIWPDCDSQKDKAGAYLPFDEQPGRKAALKIAKILVGLKCRVWIVDIDQPGVKKSGWDIADCVDEGIRGDALQVYIRNKAKEFGMKEVLAPVVGSVPDKLAPISGAEMLLERFSLIYAHGGTAFDHDERIIVKLSDVSDACQSRDAVKQWQSSSSRKIVRIENVGFDPGGKDFNVSCNLWAGWPTEPVAGECTQLLRLLKYMTELEEKETAKELYYWVIKWLAYPLQYPGAKMKSTLVIHGPQGTGKNLFFESVMAIYGKYGRIIGQDAIEDRFNDWASKKLFLIADEVVARSDLYHIKNKLKSFITGDWIRINTKNLIAYDERNHVNLVFLSNERMPVVLEEDDRRHAVIWTPEKATPDFYKLVTDEIAAGGVAALHDYLLNVDLTGFSEHTKPPMTVAKQDLIDLSRDSISLFYDDWIAGDLDGVQLYPVLSLDLFQLYKSWAGRHGIKPGSSMKMVDKLVKQHRCGKKRARFISDTSSGMHPKTFIVPENCLMEFQGKSEAAWLGDRVDEFRRVLQAYKKNTYENQ